MTREDLKDKLWKLRVVLAELESKDERVMRALGLYGKSNDVYNYLDNMEIGDALDAYKGLTDEQQRRFRAIVNTCGFCGRVFDDDQTECMSDDCPKGESK
jgi:hypothetical protein